MGIDAEGYGFPEHQKTISRLIEDIRILSPSGVERAAQGWDRHARLHGLDEMHKAEKAAVHAIEQADRGAAWDEVRRPSRDKRAASVSPSRNSMVRKLTGVPAAVVAS